MLIDLLKSRRGAQRKEARLRREERRAALARTLLHSYTFRSFSMALSELTPVRDNLLLSVLDELNKPLDD